MLTATNINCYQAEEITELGDNQVLISISDTFQPVFPLKLDKNSSKVLCVRFDDVTCDHPKGNEPRKAIDGLTALKILDFININKDKHFIVNCGAGISRSAAICMYLHIIHGHKLRDDFWTVQRSRPNQLVLGALMAYRFGRPLL